MNSSLASLFVDRFPLANLYIISRCTILMLLRCDCMTDELLKRCSSKSNHNNATCHDRSKVSFLSLHYSLLLRHANSIVSSTRCLRRTSTDNIEFISPGARSTWPRPSLRRSHVLARAAGTWHARLT